MLSESVDGVYKFTWREPSLVMTWSRQKGPTPLLTNLQVCICEHRWSVTEPQSLKWHFRTLFGFNGDVRPPITRKSLLWLLSIFRLVFFSATKQTKGQTIAAKGPMTIFVLRNGSWSCKDLARWFIELFYFLAQILAQWLNPENQPLLSDNCCGIRLQFCRLAWQIPPNSSFNETSRNIESWDNLTFFCVHPQIGVHNIQSTWILGQDKFMSRLPLSAPGVKMMLSFISLASVVSSSDI